MRFCFCTLALNCATIQLNEFPTKNKFSHECRVYPKDCTPKTSTKCNFRRIRNGSAVSNAADRRKRSNHYSKNSVLNTPKQNFICGTTSMIITISETLREVRHSKAEFCKRKIVVAECFSNIKLASTEFQNFEKNEKQ